MVSRKLTHRSKIDCILKKAEFWHLCFITRRGNRQETVQGWVALYLSGVPNLMRSKVHMWPVRGVFGTRRFR